LREHSSLSEFFIVVVRLVAANVKVQTFKQNVLELNPHAPQSLFHRVFATSQSKTLVDQIKVLSSQSKPLMIKVKYCLRQIARIKQLT